MDLAFSQQQGQLRESLRRFLTANFPFDVRREAAVHGRSPDLWRALARQLGLLGIGLPYGVEGGALERMIVAEELGRALALEPFTETVVMAAPALLANADAASADILRGIADGEIVVACALFEPRSRQSLERIETRAVRDGGGWRLNGVKSAVAAFPSADWLLVAAHTAGEGGAQDGLSLFRVAAGAAGIESHTYPTIDGRKASDLVFRDVGVDADSLIGQPGAAAPLVEAMVDRGIAAGAAEAVGIMRRALADTLAYTQVRRQFGQALADMQVIQHRLADMYVQLELASAAALLATLRLDFAPPERARAASTARIVTSKAMRFIGQNAVQLHGGMGMVDEMPVAHALKRLTMLDAEFGTLDAHVKRREALAPAA